jgi:cathepsin A (carboxypeptidase C)
MKAIASLALIGAASAAVNNNNQQPLKLPEWIPKAVSSWDKPLHQLEDALKGLTGDAKAVWDEVAMMFPEEMSKANFFSNPKPHTKRPNGEWDYIMKGEDIQSKWVVNAQGVKQREIDGKLNNYSLRTKSVDPKSLGVDDVKQYSGYLDDDEEDKHLFYCRHYSLLFTIDKALTMQRVL